MYWDNNGSRLLSYTHCSQLPILLRPHCGEKIELMRWKDFTLYKKETICLPLGKAGDIAGSDVYMQPSLQTNLTSH